MLLIDGDIIAYRASLASSVTTAEEACIAANEYIANIRHEFPNLDAYCVYLSGTGNFRNDIAVTHVYKGNRKEEKPEHLSAVRDYLLSSFPSALSSGEEADDLIAIEATRRGSNCIICSIDKDFLQVPGWHYNFVKHECLYVTAAEARLNFYMQVLTGDRIDNVVGIRGIGPKKALKHLEDIKTERGMYDRCVELYADEARVIENARLLWLRRAEGQIWQPPERD